MKLSPSVNFQFSVDTTRLDNGIVRKVLSARVRCWHKGCPNCNWEYYDVAWKEYDNSILHDYGTMFSNWEERGSIHTDIVTAAIQFLMN